MTPETLIALLTVVSILAIIGLYVVFFLFRKNSMSRLDALAHTVDFIDARLIHEVGSVEKKNEDLRAKIFEIVSAIRTDLEEKVGKESGERLESFKRIEEILQKLENDQRWFQERVEGEIAGEFRETLAGLSESAANDRDRVEEFKGYVDRVRLRNDLQLAYSLFTAADFAQTGKILESLLAEDPENKEATLLAAKAFQKTGERKKSTAVLKKGLERFPGDPDLLAELARLAGREGNRTEQARAIAEGLVHSPNHPRLHFERALLHLQSGNHDVARHDLEQVLAGGLENAEVRYNLGMVYVALGNVPAGIRELRRSIALDPLSAEGNHALGLALTHVERFREAVDFLERARELKPDDVTVRLDLAAALRLSGSPASALNETAVAGELDPNHDRVSLERALACHDLAEFGQALACLDAVLKSRPDFRRARELKAEILGELERHKEAVVEWTALTDRFPEDAELKARLASAYKDAGDREKALGFLQMAARMAPQSGKIQIQFAREALAQEKLPLVQQALETAYPKLANPRMRLRFLEGRLLFLLKMGRYALLDPLLRDLKIVLDQNPDAIPLETGFGIAGKDLLNLNLSREGARLHNGLLDLFAGNGDFGVFDDLVTEVMRSLLPPPPAPATPPEPEPVSLIASGAGDNGRDQSTAEGTEEAPSEETQGTAEERVEIAPQEQEGAEAVALPDREETVGKEGETQAPEDESAIEEERPEEESTLEVSQPQAEAVVEPSERVEEDREVPEEAPRDSQSVQAETASDRGQKKVSRKKSRRGKRKSKSSPTPSQD
jgi:tetratricopeptide (TPR) repeat protein